MHIGELSGEVPVETAVNPEHNPNRFGGITIPAPAHDSEDFLRMLEAEDSIPDAGEIDRAGSESDEDYEVSSSRKKKSKKVGYSDSSIYYNIAIQLS